jgi:PAS domain S-box-containing protein
MGRNADENRPPASTAEREATFRLFIESVRDYAIFMLDAEGRVASWNAGAERIKQYRQEEIVGKHFSVFYPPEAVARRWPEHELEVAAREGRFEDEGWRVRKDGTRFWANVVITAVHDDRGRLRGFAKVTRDMTERRNAQEQSVRLAQQQAARAEAERANARLQALVEFSRTLAEAGLDVDAIAEAVCRQATRVVGEGCVMAVLRERELRPIASHHEDREAAERLANGPGGVVVGDDSVVGRALNTRAVAVVARPDPTSGLPLAPEFLERHAVSEALVVPMTLSAGAGAVLVLIRRSGTYSSADRLLVESLASRAALALANATLYADVQEAHEQLRRALEEVTGMSRMKDQFLATLSHELRTPLNAIVGWVHLMKSTTLDPPLMAKAIDTIARNAETQSQLIGDILDVSAIVSGKTRLNVRAVDPAHAIDDAIDTLRPAAEGKQVKVEAVLDRSAGPISGDPERLQQIVWNLVSNAIKFAPKGGRVVVRLEAVRSEVKIAVEDDGPGIPEDFLPHVFERFRQADASSTRGYKGLGLGLAIVRHLVELHGGEVHAGNREDGPGAVFTVVLPRRPVAVPALPPGAPALQRVSTEVVDIGPSLSGVRVLVVEDDDDARDLLTISLQQAGAEVRATGSAPSVLQLLPDERPHVLLADVEMPGMDGYTLMSEVRRLPRDRGGLTPAIALTAYAGIADRVRALSAGFDLHLAKPVQIRELRAAVARLAVR